MTTPILTCEHCDSEIDVAKDPKCVVYDPSGATDVMCEECRKQAYDSWSKGLMERSGPPTLEQQQAEAKYLKREWRA